MFDPIVVVFKGTARVVRRVNIDTLDFASKLLFQCLKGKEVVAKDKSVIEDVMVGDAMRGVAGLVRAFQENARLQP